MKRNFLLKYKVTKSYSYISIYELFQINCGVNSSYKTFILEHTSFYLQCFYNLNRICIR